MTRKEGTRLKKKAPDIVLVFGLLILAFLGGMKVEQEQQEQARYDRGWNQLEAVLDTVQITGYQLVTDEGAEQVSEEVDKAFHREPLFSASFHLDDWTDKDCVLEVQTEPLSPVSRFRHKSSLIKLFECTTKLTYQEPQWW